MSEHANGIVDVVVIGGGISGLAAAQSALRAGASVLVLEAGAEVGGVMQTETRDGFLVEHGPTSMAASAATRALLSDVGLASQIEAPVAGAKRRYVVRNGTMHALPSSPPGLLRSKLLSARGKLRVLAEPWVPRVRPDLDESLAALVQRRFGKELLDYFVDPFVSGVCAGDARRLSKWFTLRTLHELEQEHRSVILGALKRARRAGSAPSAPILSLRGGMHQLPAAFRHSIETAHDGAVRTQARVTQVARTGATWEVRYALGATHEVIEAHCVVCALPAHALAAVACPAGWRNSVAQISAVRYAPIATVALGFREAQITRRLDGFGVLFPSVGNHRILGALFNSSMFTNRAPDGHCLVTAFVGGSRVSAVPTTSDAIEMALSELTPLLGISGKPVTVSVAQWQTGIPQLELGHPKVLDAVGDIEQQSSETFFTGSHLSGVAIGDCLAHGRATGRRAAAAALRSGAASCNILARTGASVL